MAQVLKVTAFDERLDRLGLEIHYTEENGLPATVVAYKDASEDEELAPWLIKLFGEIKGPALESYIDAYEKTIPEEPTYHDF